MALNSSGPISLAGSTAGESIALELSLSPTGQISLDDAAVRNLLAKPNQYSEISLADAYGKSSYVPPTLVMGITSRFNNQFVYKGYGNGAAQFPETVPQMGSLSQTTFTSPGTGGTATFNVFGLYSLSAYGDPYRTYLICPTNADTNQGNEPIWININGANYEFWFGGSTYWRRIQGPLDVLNYGIGSSVIIGAIYGTQPPGPIY
jgi:hypothetical protein